MDIELFADVGADPAAVAEIVADLGTYPRWLTLVSDSQPAPAHPNDQGPAWNVTLTAGVGPLRITKQVRMVRTTHQPTKVRFDRFEHDNQPHPAWILQVALHPTEAGTHLTVHLHYAGAPPIPGLDHLMKREATTAATRLETLLNPDR